MHLYVVNNTIVNNRGSGVFVNNASNTSALLENNVFQGSGTLVNGPNTQTTNWVTSNAYLAAPSNYYFELTASSSGALDSGTAPGTGVDSFDMTPTQQYVHPLMHQDRPTNGTIDIGAFEYLRTYQEGVNSYTGVADSYMLAGGPTTNYGSSVRLTVCGYADLGAGNVMRPVIKFDLSAIPTNATIGGATLYVYSYDAAAVRGSSGTYGLYPLTRAFVENQVTWNVAATGTDWTTAGGDFSGTADATADKEGTAGVWYAFDVSSRVQDMISDPSSNYGWIIKCTDEDLHNQDRFSSSDNSDVQHRPKLVITGY